MWYAVQCRQGQEECILRSLQKNLPKELAQDVFLLRYEKMKRYKGDWHLLLELLIPGYIFLESTDMEGLNNRLKDYPGIVKLLGEENRMTAIYREEEDYLKGFCKDRHDIEMSRGYIRQGITHITQGPLAGYEDKIRKIDRHKRIALLPCSLCRKIVEIKVGLEIITRIA